MKKYLLLALIISFLSLKSYAQSTEIRPGSVLPQMTTAQRTALAAVNGMLVFDTGTQSYWVRRSGAWTEVPTSAAAVNFWQQTGAGGNEIKNTNTGGFWSANPVGLAFSADNSTNPPTAPINGVGTRLMWIPSRSAFRVGTINTNGIGSIDAWDANNIGLYSFASGVNTKAIGERSTAMGNFSVASGYESTAFGSSQASGESATSFGQYGLASGYCSTAMGKYTKATNFFSVAMGFYTTASGNYSTAIGINNIDNSNGLFMVGNGNATTPYTAFIIRKDNSRVGIGVEDPLAPLHVAGFGFLTGLANQNSSFFYPNSIALTQNSINAYQANTSILADEGIISRTYLGAVQTVVSSDSRIKNIISLSNNTSDLALLKKIEITDYRMKDVATWGNQTFKKVIAQQVEAIYPEAIKKQTAVIPDIYTLAENVSYNAANKQLTVNMAKNYGIKITDKLELVHPEKGKIQAEVIAVNGNSFTVKDWNYAADKIFVFGREVNDFRSVDYEALSMLGISAIQALAKENEEMKKENAKQKEDYNKRIEGIEASVKALTKSINPN